MTLPPPFLPLSSIPNIRDVGGYRASPSSLSSSSSTASAETRGSLYTVIRSQILYRSGNIHSVTDQDLQQLRDVYHVRTIIDVRSVQQIERQGGVREFQGIQRVWAPVFGAEEYGEEEAERRYGLYSAEGTGGILEAFLEILTSGKPTLRTLFHHLSELPLPTFTSPTPATLIHCTTGNNRTSALLTPLLLTLGMSREDIFHDYTLSQLGLNDSREAAVERLVKRSKLFQGEGGRERAKRMLGSRAESMEALIEALMGMDDGVEGLLRKAGIEQEVVESVRRVMLSEENLEEDKRSDDEGRSTE